MKFDPLQQIIFDGLLKVYDNHLKLGEKGKLKDEKVDEVLENVKNDIIAVGGKLVGLVKSPIVGEKGKNKEFLAMIIKE